ncbi:MAG: carboxypeptidase regulatory-like domain-containing protein [Pyrinomonadaceae bacterium]
MKKALRFYLTLLVVCAVCGANALPSLAATAGRSPRTFGTVTGSVRDAGGNPLAGAVVSLMRDGANEIVKQTRSAADGSFSARIAPGRYTVRAIAEGFEAALFSSVQVRSSDELVYRFNLERIGSGRTAPERRADRDDAKWAIRAAQSRRSVFQIQESETNTVEAAREDADQTNSVTASADTKAKETSRTQGVVETYVASASGSSFNSAYAGLNFALAQPLNERLDLIFAGQTGTGAAAPQRFEGTAHVRTADNRHRLSIRAGAARVGTILSPAETTSDAPPPLLAQLSFKAVDEMIARDGVVVVLGFDYSRFVGASQAHSISPRLGVQYDANARTRLKAAYAPESDDAAMQGAAKFEGGDVVFKQPATKPVALAHGRARMERSRRFEFGVERVLDNASSVEATAFFDTTSNRGVGLFNAPLSAFANDGEAADGITSIANQEGAARGLRVVYARRLNQILSASAGYSFGRGQKLSPEGLTNAAEIFANGFFQTAALQVTADLGTGTRVRTVFRFSPNATVFAIDPFAGRLAVYDPSLSVIVTQDLPTFGLPVRAEAIVDARNLLDAQTYTEDGDARAVIGTAARRSVRGGLSVRF